VNTYTTGEQYAAHASMDASSRYAVVWTSPSDGSGFGTAAQRFGSADLIFADGFE
jgi:hypothetical protein